MRLTFIQLSTFVADWRRMNLDDDDLRALEATLLENPERGPVMSGTGGLRKIRFAPPSRHTGKSGAMRVCYAHVPAGSAVILAILFAKNEKANLTPAERGEIKALLERVRRSLT